MRKMQRIGLRATQNAMCKNMAAMFAAIARDKPLPKKRPTKATGESPVPAEKPVEPTEAPNIAGGNPPTLPAALKRPAAAGPVHAVAVPVHAAAVPVH